MVSSCTLLFILIWFRHCTHKMGFSWDTSGWSWAPFSSIYSTFCRSGSLVTTTMNLSHQIWCFRRQKCWYFAGFRDEHWSCHGRSLIIAGLFSLLYLCRKLKDQCENYVCFRELSLCWFRHVLCFRKDPYSIQIVFASSSALRPRLLNGWGLRPFLLPF